MILRKNGYSWVGVKENFFTEVSVSIGLNTEYEGGEFELESWGGRTVRIDRGTAVIFCGHELHKAHPVHKGVRYSLTAWRKGNR